MKRPVVVSFAALLVSSQSFAQSVEPARVAEPAPVSNAPASAAPAPEEARIEVTVVGVARAPGSAHVISKKQLERFEYDDPHAILVQTPGVYLRGEDGVGLRPNVGLRGTNPDRSKKVTLLEDGVLFGPAPYSAPAAYYFPMMTRMTQVRVIKGPGAIAYGPQTVGGAIDLITRPIPTNTAGALDVAFGEYGYNKVHGHFGSSNEQTGFLVEGLRLSNEGFKELPNGADTGSTRNEWMAKFSYAFDPSSEVRNELGLKLSYSDEVSNETYLGLSDRDFRENPLRRYAASALDRMKNHRTSLVLTHELETGPLKLTTHVYRHDFARIWRKINHIGSTSLLEVLSKPDDPILNTSYSILKGEIDTATGSEVLFVGPNDRTFVSQGVQSTLDLRGATGPLAHRAQLGVRLHNDEIIRRHSESGFRMTAGRLVPDGEPTRVTEANTARTIAVALDALDAITWQRLSVTPGVRVEILSSRLVDDKDGGELGRNVVAVMPGLGIYSGLTDELGLLLGVHRGFSPPPAGAQKPIEPEYSVNYEVGARYTVGPARAEAIAFYNDYSNLTNTCTEASGCSVENLDEQFDAGKARIYGLEVYLGHELRAGVLQVPFFAAYTYTQAEFARSFQSDDPIFGDVRAGDEIPYVPEHQLALSAGVDSPIAGGAVAVNYVSAMREVPGSGPVSSALATDDQVWIDLEAHLRPIDFLTIYAQLRNAFDSHDIVSHRPYGARPNAPRWLQVGGKVAF
jgi:Fe(3+) dicitrate transport protein